MQAPGFNAGRYRNRLIQRIERYVNPVKIGRLSTSRWSNSMNEKLDGVVSGLVAKTARDRGKGWQADEGSVRQLIDDDIAWNTYQTGRAERSIRYVAVLQCMKRDLLHEILAELAR